MRTIALLLLTACTVQPEPQQPQPPPPPAYEQQQPAAYAPEADPEPAIGFDSEVPEGTLSLRISSRASTPATVRLTSNRQTSDTTVETLPACVDLVAQTSHVTVLTPTKVPLTIGFQTERCTAD